jgi:hypothetical protein
MAIATILCDRCVFPKIGSTFFGMTVEAGVVQRLLHELKLIGLTMIAVAAAAIHLALPNRVGVGLQRLRPLLLVAIETNFRLRGSRHNRILSRVARVAIRAGYFVDVMIVAVPAKARVRCVAIHAEAILRNDRCRRT